MITDSSRERERRRIEQRLAELEIERRALEAARQALDGAAVNGNASRSSVTQQTNKHEKVLLFRSLFRGRTDVYPARWENKSSGKSGYAPACANEWVRGVCEKPRVKCGDCTKQAFIAVSDHVVERHLRGDIVAGLSPLVPGVISRAELHAHHIALPRGCIDEVREVFTIHGVQIDVTDERCRGEPLVAKFMGTLQPEQQRAAEALLAHDHGVLAATTAFGKTVRAIPLIAARACNVLILVHRQQLLDQWVEQLQAFLDVEPDAIGTMGGGKKRLTGKIDGAMIQSLMRNHDDDERVLTYGHLIVDECHHGSVVSFEAVIKRARGRYVLGLSATVARKDCHQPIGFMQCGPAVHRLTARAQLAARGGIHPAEMRETGLTAAELMRS